MESQDAMTDEQRETLELVAKLIREKKLDRRKLMQTAAAMGLGTTAAAAGVAVTRVPTASAQDGPLLMTVSTEQQPTWIRNFNPLLEQNSSRWPTQSGIYEPMAVFNEMTGELVPWLATEWSFNADNTALTFTLREGVKWADGEALDSADVKFTFDLLIGNEALPGTESVRSTLPNLSGVDAPDATTVVFNFSKVFTPGIYGLAQQNIVPEHIWKDVADPVTFLNENPVGSGPFNQIGEFADQYYEILKNPSYWQEGKPYIEGFRFPAYPDNAAANLAMVSGEIDIASNFIADIEKVYVAEDPENFHYWFPPTGADVHLYANTSMAPFDNADVRKAISMAIDRDQIVAVAMFDYTHPADATGMSDAFNGWKDQAIIDAGTWVKRDVAAANALLDAAGLTLDGDVRKLPDGTAMEYDLNVVSGWSDWVSSCQIMAQNLEEIGIKATVQTYDQAAWQDRVMKADFQLSIGWSDQGATPLDFYEGVMGSVTKMAVGETSARNWHRFSLPEADALFEQFAATSDEAEQKAIVTQLQQLYSDNTPAIPLFPGPQWAEFNTMRFMDFPSAENPYTLPSTYSNTERLILITTVKPKA
jgi:peptide/nickel transport system substrate-binding protein